MTRKLTIIAALLLFCACHHTDPEPVTPPEPETYKLTLGASMEDLTKAGVSGSGKVTWQSDDRIAVLLDDGSVVSLSLENGAGSTSATFSGDVPAGRTFAGKAAYPWWEGAWSASSNELVLTMPESVVWSGNDYVPVVMKADASGDSLPFKHVGAVMRFTIGNIPESITSFKFATSGGAVMGRDDLTYTFIPAAATRVFHVPVNAGTLPAYTISLQDASGTVLLSKTKSKTTNVSRCDFRILTPLDVSVGDRFRVVSYNVLNGMERDSENGYDNFVAWVRSMEPDVLVLCEAGDMHTRASRWGHDYAERLYLDSFPVAITSSHPLTVEKTVTNSSKVKHGAIYVTVGGYDLVALHLRPTIDDDKDGSLSAEEYAKYGELRKTELQYIIEQTVSNPVFSGRGNWIVCGDFNAYSPLEKMAVSPYGGKSAYRYPEPTASVCYEVYPIIADVLKDVLYYKGGSAFKPTMYHGRSRLDYIFAAESLYNSVDAADVVLGGFPGNYRSDDANPSDHMPLYMDLVTYAFKVLDGKTRLEDWPEEDLVKEN